MLAGAEAASRGAGSTADKLAAMSAAWFGTYVETIWPLPARGRPDGCQAPAVAGLVTQTPRAGTSGWSGMSSHRAADSGELDLERAGLTADTAAELLIAAGRGLEPSASSPAAYRRQLTTLVRVMIAGLASRHPANRP